MTLKETLKKTWNFIWNDDSLLSWLLSLALAFIIIKFVFFPLLSFVLATSLPLVIVESSSMHHPGSFVANVAGTGNAIDLWWQEAKLWYEEKGIDRSDIDSWSFRTGLEKGDIVLAKGVKPEKLKVGDVIIFDASQKHPIIHRIIEKKETSSEIVFETKGDNNSGQLTVEKNVSQEQLIGKAVFRIPKLGWVKLVFIELFS